MTATPDRYDVTRETGYKTPGRRLNNWTATTDPTATDDESAHYEPGSRWINTSTGFVWTCTDATASAAVWKTNTLLHEELTDVAADQHHARYTDAEAVAAVAATAPWTTWYAAPGSSPPTANETGDLWLDTDDGTVYEWDGSSWVDTGADLTGPAGADGNVWYDGAGTPVGGTGADDDYYLESS